MSVGFIYSSCTRPSEEQASRDAAWFFPVGFGILIFYRIRGRMLVEPAFERHRLEQISALPRMSGAVFGSATRRPQRVFWRPWHAGRNALTDMKKSAFAEPA